MVLNNMKAFFDFSIDNSYQNGFGLFSFGHFFWLLAALLICRALCLRFKNSGDDARRRLRLTVALTALALELLRAGLLLAAGRYGPGSLPLHLCGLAVYIGALHALRPGELTGQFLYAFCMPGAAFALLFPDWSYYPFWHFITVSGFLLHILLVAYTLMQVVGGAIRPDIRKAPRCLLIMLAVALPIYLFDRAAGLNFMFLNWPSPGSPLEWFAFLGRPGYLLGYLPLLAAVWALLYLPFRKRMGPA